MLMLMSRPSLLAHIKASYAHAYVVPLVWTMLYLCLYLSCIEEWALYRDCLKLIMPILSLLMKFCTVPIQNLAPEQYSMIILEGEKFSAYM